MQHLRDRMKTFKGSAPMPRNFGSARKGIALTVMPNAVDDQTLVFPSYCLGFIGGLCVGFFLSPALILAVIWLA